MMMRMPNCDHKVFSNLVQNQISHNASLDDSPAAATLMQAVKPPPDASEDSGGRQILASWNPGLKRSERKKEVKKVVCIPAPAAANSRTSGEVVPSDLWAWRKYGQKPIKGSPYPRGYYRCSSSKGCSARKQVERSRTDPNMLVITYNSEHNHPWPTQRNALAGSVRSHHHHSKTNNDSDQTMASKVIMDLKQQKSNVVAENCAAERSSSSNSGSACASSSSLKPKQEMMMMDQKSNEMDGGDQLFAELGELFMEAHDDDDDDDDDHDQYHYPLNLLVSQGFDDYAAHHHHDHHTQCRGLNDPFHDDLFNSLS
ncbi:putative WRKY transcription factor 14 [Senna tora]|uniref:Putative WRKY transcription factor 14 n=1 Tax=Senna tora TaxID=362788 RepID=A0A835CI79_9FABA|nr:putative WRKY transcription factor 14 [Senna tora]